MEIRRILVIRYRRVGDSVLALSLLHTLRENFPDAVIDYVLDSNIAPLFECHPYIDNVIAFTNEEKHSLPVYLKKVWKVAHGNRYDVIIDLRSTVQTLWFSLFSLRSEFRIGRRKGYNALLQNCRPRIPWEIDMVSQNLMFAGPLEKIKRIVPCRDFRLFPTEEEVGKFRGYMAECGIDFRRPVIVAAVATRIPGKVWDRERMKEVLGRIAGNCDAQIIFNYGGKAEEDYAAALYEDMGKDSHLFVNVRAGSVRELMAMIANCDFFFGNEGGPRHIAHALDVPSFAIYPPWISKTTWLPANDGRHQGIAVDDIAGAYVSDEMTNADKFALITVDEVWRRLRPMLDIYLKPKSAGGK